jgi:hypothetical protein
VVNVNGNYIWARPPMNKRVQQRSRVLPARVADHDRPAAANAWNKVGQASRDAPQLARQDLARGHAGQLKK